MLTEVDRGRAFKVMASMRFNVFGREILVIRSETGWELFYPGEGKRRPALDLMMPPDISESEIEQYLGDLCHEWATARHPSVTRIEEDA